VDRGLLRFGPDARPKWPAARRALWLLAGAQLAAGVVVGRRLARGQHRPAPLAAGPAGTPGAVSVLIPARDEERRLGPLLDALRNAGPEVAEVIVVDDESRDGTSDLVRAAAARDPRVRLVVGAPLRAGWVGKQWALQQALELASAPWVLALDADVRPDPALPAALVAAAEADGFDVLSGGPRFDVGTVAERVLHPVLLATLVYRFGPPGEAERGRELANGQCLLVRRERLLAAGGWGQVADRMTEDVALARTLAAAGWAVGVRDAAALLLVDMHDSGREAWTEWGRSIALPDVASGREQATDVACTALTMALPLPLLVMALHRRDVAPAVVAGALLAMRLGLHAALRHTYEQRGPAWWAAPLADGLAVVRLAGGAVAPSRRWRGRTYG